MGRTAKIVLMIVKQIFLFLSFVFSSLTAAPEKSFSDVPRVTLSTTLKSQGKNISVSFNPTDSTSSCTYTLIGSLNRARVSAGTKIFTLGGHSSKTTLTGRSVSSLRGRSSSTKVYFVTRTKCDSESRLSNIASVSIKTRSSGLSKSQWFKDTSKKLILGSLKVRKTFSALSFTQPIDLQNAGDGSRRLFVAEQTGKIWSFSDSTSTTSKSLYLDISDKIETGGSEQGLLGFAFHPQFETNHLLYVHYSKKGSGDTVVSRFQEDPNTGTVSVATETIFLEQEQPFDNHNGGQIQFGPDGYLYIGLGDGGSGGDPQGNGQKLTTLLGKLLRIDVNSAANGKNYSIPSDNPFKNAGNGSKEEIFAYGLRNPWRFSFDTISDRIWLADVGQNAYEEVDVIESGKNYGWNTMEGSHCYSPSSGCSQSGLTLPVTEYSHDEGLSITGGFVYRGSSTKSLKGLYIFADFVTGRIWALSYDGVKAIRHELFDTALNISSFGIDENSELYFLSYSDGAIYHLAN